MASMVAEVTREKTFALYIFGFSSTNVIDSLLYCLSHSLQPIISMAFSSVHHIISLLFHLLYIFAFSVFITLLDLSCKVKFVSISQNFKFSSNFKYSLQNLGAYHWDILSSYDFIF